MIENLVRRRNRQSRGQQLEDQFWPKTWSGRRVGALAIQPRMEAPSGLTLLPTHRLVGLIDGRRIVLTPITRCSCIPHGSSIVTAGDNGRLWIGVILPPKTRPFPKCESTDDALLFLSLTRGEQLQRDRLRFSNWEIQTDGTTTEIVKPALLAEQRVGSYLADSYELLALPWSLIAKMSPSQPRPGLPLGLWMSIDWPWAMPSGVEIQSNVGLFTDEVREVLHVPLVGQIDESTLSVRPCVELVGEQQVRINQLRDDGGIVWPDEGHLRLPGPRYTIVAAAPGSHELCRIRISEPVQSPVLDVTYRPAESWSRTMLIESACEELEGGKLLRTSGDVEDSMAELPETLPAFREFVATQTPLGINHWVDVSNLVADIPRPYLHADGHLWSTIRLHAPLKDTCSWSDSEIIWAEDLLTRRLNQANVHKGVQYVVQLG